MTRNAKTAIACSSSNEYAPYLSVWLQSILDHASKNTNYHIFVFERDITEINKNKLRRMLPKDNFSLTFINPTELFKGVTLTVTFPYFKEECYFRVAAPVILNQFERIIFTDLDLVFQVDPLNLAHIDLKGNIIAACKEAMFPFIYKENPNFQGFFVQTYTDNVLKISPENYFNTGVVVFDVKRYNERNTFEKIIDLIKDNHFLYQEQCALNIECNGKIHTLCRTWNFEISDILLHNHEISNYVDDFENANIIHFLGALKPWKDPSAEYAYLWWQYAQKTPFYEEILSRLIDFKISERLKVFNQQKLNNTLLYMALHPVYFRLKKLRYRLMKHITFGKKKEKYEEKYKSLKTQIKASRQFIIDDEN